jgi:hypothetical protein
VSRIIDESLVLAGVDCTTLRSVTLDLGEVDIISIGVTIISCNPIIKFTLNESVDGVNYVQVAAITECIEGTTIWHIGPVFSRWKKVIYNPDGGGVATFTVTINAHNNTITSTGSKVPFTVEL